MPKLVGADGRIDIKSLSLPELEAELVELGLERFRGLQVYKWLWQRGARSFGEMTNLSRPVRESLERSFAITWLELETVLPSRDGTRKYLWRTSDGHAIESVLIPDGGPLDLRPRAEAEGGEEEERGRVTLCVSTQVGCAMACSFCLTGDLGLKRHLTPAEIANQPLQVQRSLPEGARLTNLVMMGMGEPLHNYPNLVPALRNLLHDHGQNFSHRRITVSTVGLVPMMTKLLEEVPVQLAVSLNASTEEQRRAVMPITRKYSMAALLDACRQLPLKQRERVTFEYVMMAGFNDGMDDAARLVRLVHGVRAKVNLLPYNENPDRPIRRPSPERVKQFQHYLVSHGVQASVRTTRGIDISAACGQLGKAAVARIDAAVVAASSAE